MKKKKTEKNETIIFNYRYRDPCSASINEDDLHTTKLTGDGNKKVSTMHTEKPDILRLLNSQLIIKL